MKTLCDRLGTPLEVGQVITWTSGRGTRSPLNLGFIKDITDKGALLVEKVSSFPVWAHNPETGRMMIAGSEHVWSVSTCRAAEGHITVVRGISRHDLRERYPQAEV